MVRRSIAALSAILVASCGGGEATPDAGGPQLHQLEILDPPGESLGLPYATGETLRVRYRDATGEPIPGAPVRFTLVATGSESTGGSTLSAASATTDGLGIAQVELVAGAERVNFRVEASASSAAVVLFYVAVSEGGFTDLRVTPEHEGARAPGELDAIQLRLYRAVDLRCPEVDIDALPASVFPPRSLDRFGQAARFRNLGAGDAYTLVAWATGESDVALAAGCLALGAEQARSSGTVYLDIVVTDRAAELGDPLSLASAFDLTPLRLALPGAARWSTLACPLGPAQLLVDCALDAHEPDGQLDCVVGASDALIAAAQARRGAVDASGCRPATIGGVASLDALVADAMAGGPWPADASVGGGYAELFTGVIVHSRLSHAGDDLARHTLSSAHVSAGGGEWIEDLLGSDRPVVVDPSVGFTVAADGSFDVAEHGFTLRTGDLLGAAFADLVLDPAGLSARSTDLGSALVETVDTAGAAAGCPSLDDVLCGATGSPDGCLGGCSQVAPALDVTLSAWRPELDAGGLDFALRGTGVAWDDGDDLRIDSLAGVSSAWEASISVASGSAVTVDGFIGSSSGVP